MIEIRWARYEMGKVDLLAPAEEDVFELGQRQGAEVETPTMNDFLDVDRDMRCDLDRMSLRLLEVVTP